ncbi:hypothetical protein [Flavobacterium sp. 3HN19-14]|uniref:hypothetical protein n=1 Tax=Flavobacterium sp. 3HN19-14 TaxID=3448133 RepID=UPI003EE02C8B
MSYKLWVSDRLFPLIPPFDFLEGFTAETHLALFYAALSGIFLIFLFPKGRFALFLAIAIEFCSCMLDQNRWQPWELQYMITVLFAFFYRDNPKQFLNYFTFLIVIIYFNSGLHKLNGSFLYDVWESMILRRFFGVEESVIAQKWVHFAGLSLGIIEVVGALGILFFKRKKFFALLLIGMHIFILAMISPTGLNYNIIVWPWNVVMIILIYILIFNQSEARVSFYGLMKGANFIPFIFIGILPILCNFGLYDNFLSFNLYSGSLKQLEICVKDDGYVKDYKPYFSNKKNFCGEDYKVLNANFWSLKEMNIIVYPEERIYLGVIKKWKQRNPKADATFHIYQYPYKPENIREIK